jgi:glycosyltransferase involved in cell wall biosynthesis
MSVILDTAPKICFIAPEILPIFSGNQTKSFGGGAEVQQTFIARALQQRGYSISILTDDFGQPDDYELNGTRIIKLQRKGLSIPGLRYVYPRLTCIWQAMAKANADIYYQRCAGAITGLVGAFTQYHRKKFIFSAASNNDVLATLPHIHGWRDRALFSYGLKRADSVVVQNPEQMNAYQDWMKKQGIWIRSCYAAPDTAQANAEGTILWVGMMRPGKRPHLVFELAKQLPQFQFKLIGGSSSAGDANDYYQSIIENAKKTPNVEYIGFVPYEKVDTYFNSARLFINTSESEGFPNTFLQAWARGIPTVSFINCGATDSLGSIGFIADNESKMIENIYQLMTNETLWLAEGQRCKNYFTAHHSIHHTIECYEQLITKLIKQS